MPWQTSISEEFTTDSRNGLVNRTGRCAAMTTASTAFRAYKTVLKIQNYYSWRKQLKKQAR